MNLAASPGWRPRRQEGWLPLRRKFLQAVSSEKVRASNLNCTVEVDVRHDGSEPCVDVLFGDGDRLILRGAHLTAQEMLAAFGSRVQAKSRTLPGEKG
ncbi:39S ribosomal protein L53, mitochondrial isoform X2 [Monodelphis domestica]|uniref:39S ribosomal protein L53, mitochondrial isoform X2 n=1 Tax=Monodelphis domestica TaxID=13616 RepID=UPI0004435C57|nr:39S ribosomal protein L53, mitochondrial isoform X2 [Monodelphis domestica]XP_056659620.1 39S ribosomal protein L53, mitochondrial isoform X2 [Monodelphis domestica]